MSETSRGQEYAHDKIGCTVPLRNEYLLRNARRFARRSRCALREARASDSDIVYMQVLCQQRKVKCDRNSPCNNCNKAGLQCVPAALAPRQRRRRFAERELLDRLRHYEDLLRQHSISSFEPLHPSANVEKERGGSISTAGRYEPNLTKSSIESPTSDPENVPKAKCAEFKAP